MTNDYEPISCDLHSVLELLAMRRARVVARAHDPDAGEQQFHGRVSDVLTRSGAEYLVVAAEDGDECSIRLDRLQDLHSPDGALLWRQ